jgi:uncharacterized membrane protein YeaQ/YmgE (transglycosylase-associated protein family)
MNYYLSFLFNALKVGYIFNIITGIWGAIYVFFVESYFQPFQLKSAPVIEFGTAVAGFKIYNTAEPDNYEIRPA